MTDLFRLHPNMRWFGPQDPVPLAHLAQAGCEGVVSALHAIPVGEVWPVAAIRAHQQEITAAGLQWKVVESLPVHDEIKRQGPLAPTYLANYQQSLRHLAQCGVEVVTYNFMPVLDWVRTDLAYRLPNGAEALRFDRLDFMVFDLFLLARPQAQDAYSRADLAAAEARYQAMSEARRQQVFRSVLLGLPGSDEAFTPQQLLQMLAQYEGIDHAQLQAHLVYFLTQIAPVAEEVGIKLAIHPDDPPFSVLGLPRVMSTADDITRLMRAVNSPANGLCFCTGSLGAGPDNDLSQILHDWGSRVYFLHLRNVQHQAGGDFFEAEHLNGSVDLSALMQAVVALMQRERRRIPMRPDHGHKILDDFGKATYPGYSAIGRLKGLAELRGLEYALASQLRAE
jgi:mannonate dehydratase